MDVKKSYKVEQSWSEGPWELCEEFDEKYEAKFAKAYLSSLTVLSREWAYRIRYVEEHSKLID
jgi:hypothetical protein